MKLTRLAERTCTAVALVMVAAADARGQTVPGPSPTTPTVFGPGIFHGGDVFRGAFAPDGRTLYFFRKVGTGEDYRIFVSRFAGGRWSEPQRVDLGGEYSDLYPSVSRDGRRLVFSSYRPLPGDTARNAHVWIAERAGRGWGPPRPLAEANRPGYYHSGVEFGADDAIHFRRIAPDWQSRETLVARRDPGGPGYLPDVPWEPATIATRLRPDLSIAGGSPGPREDLVFLDVPTRDSASGRRASDIWIMERNATGWSQPRPLDPGINGPEFETFPFFSPDGRDLFFVRAFATVHRVNLDAALQRATGGPTAAPDPVRQAPDTMAPAGLAASALGDTGLAWQHRRVAGFRVHFLEGSYAARHQDSLLARLPAARRRAEALLRVAPLMGLMDVFFVDTRDQMNRLVGGRATGFAQPSARAVFLVNPTWRAFERDEIMHVVAWHAWGRPAPGTDWLQEGLAQAADRRCGRHSNATVLRGLTRRQGWIPLSDVLERFLQQPDPHAYLQAAAFSDYLLRSFGPAALAELWHNRATPDTPVAGRSLTLIERDWRTAVSQGAVPDDAELAAIEASGCGVGPPPGAFE